MKASTGSNIWEDAVLAGTILAMDPAGFGGVLMRGKNDAAFSAWLDLLKRLLPPNAKVNRIAAHIGTDRLVGGLDVAASLREGRPMMEHGVLASAHDGVLVLTSAERMPADKCALVAAAMDNGEITVARDGLFNICPARFGLVALDEGQDEAETLSTILSERLAFQIELPVSGEGDLTEMSVSHEAIEKVRQRFSKVRIGIKMQEALCNAALALGIGSLRVALFVVKVARAHAAVMGRRSVTKIDCSFCRASCPGIAGTRNSSKRKSGGATAARKGATTTG